MLDISLEKMAIAELLQLHVQIAEELRGRGIMRSANNPTGELAEHLFCAAFDWEQAGNSQKGFDATGAGGLRYQIKGRRIHRRIRGSLSGRQLSAIRGLDGKSKNFDMLAGVLFEDDYEVQRAALIPWVVVKKRALPQPYVRGHRFILRDEIWDIEGVEDVTKQVREAFSQLR